MSLTLPFPVCQICAHLWEFTLVFGSWYLSNRCMMWYVHRGTEGGSQELWRGSQVRPECLPCGHARAWQPWVRAYDGWVGRWMYAAPASCNLHTGRSLQTHLARLHALIVACLPVCLLCPGVQMWVWMAPNHLKAIWKVLVAENAIVKRLFNFEIGFTVTSKEKAEESRWAALKKAFTVTWPHLLYYLAFFAGIVYFIVTAALNYYT
jgi:hypothetical protein